MNRIAVLACVRTAHENAATLQIAHLKLHRETKSTLLYSFTRSVLEIAVQTSPPTLTSIIVLLRYDLITSNQIGRGKKGSWNYGI